MFVVGLYTEGQQDPKPGEFVAQPGSAFLHKCKTKAEGLKWLKVEANREWVTKIVGDSPIVFTNNKGKVLK